MPDTHPITVAIVPHTHWDREWYSPFQTFRMRLVQAARRAAADARVATSRTRASCSTARPRCSTTTSRSGPRPRAALRRLAAAGRLSIGPWMILMDEFMVSGETIVRDLQLGIARGARARRRDARRLPPRHVRPRRADAAAPAARRPRARGRVARRARRGRRRPRSGGRRPTARACAPSTSTARTRTAATSPTTRSGSCARASTTSSSSAPARLGDDAPDERHRPPDAAAVARARRRRGERGAGRLPSSSSRRCAEYLAAAADRRPRDRGPASCARARGPTCSWASASNRVDVHQACAAAERALERRAEPLSALFLPRRRSTRTRSLDIAWRKLVLNSAHDSSCACSADEVVDQVLVRYHEARQIGDGLDARRACTRSPREVDAPAGVDRRREPDRRATAPGSSRSRVPGDGPVHFVALDDGTRVPDPGRSATIGGDGFSTDGHRPEGPLGARPDARPRVRGPPASRRYERRPQRDGVVRRHAARGAGRGDDARSTSTSSREQLLALGEDGHDDPRPRHAPRRCADVARSTPAPIAGFGWRRFTGVDGDGPGRPRSTRPTPRSRTSTCASTVDPRDRHLRDRDRRRPPASTGSAGSSTAATAATPTTTPRPPTTSSSTARTRCAVDDARVRSGAGPRARSTPTYTLARARGRRRARRARRAATRPCAVDGAHHARAARRRAVPARRARARQPRPRPPAARPLPAARAGRPAPTPSARSRSCTAASPPRAAPHEFGLPDVPVAPLRRRVRRHAPASRSCTTACSSTRWSTTARELALTLLRATGYLSRSEPSLRPNPAGPPDPARAARSCRARSAPSTRCCSTAATGAPPTATRAADAFLVPLERARARRRPARRRPRDGRARCASTAPRSPRCCATPGGLVVRVFRTAAEPGPVTIEHDGAPARGWIVDLARPPGRAVRGRRRAPPVGDLHPPTHVTESNASDARSALAEELEDLDRLVEAGERGSGRPARTRSRRARDRAGRAAPRRRARCRARPPRRAGPRG